MALVKKGMPIWFDFGNGGQLETGLVTDIIWRRKFVSKDKYNSFKPWMKKKYKKTKIGTYYKTYPFTVVELSQTKESFAIPYWLYEKHQTGLLFEGSKGDLMSEEDFKKLLKKESK